MQDSISHGDNLYKLLDMHIEEATPEYSRVTMPLAKKILNGMGFAHGGAIFALADIAFGAASNCQEETGTVSLSTSIQFLSTGTKGPLTAEAHLVRGGRHIVSYAVEVHDAAGTLLATATAMGFKTEFKFLNKTTN